MVALPALGAPIDRQAGRAGRAPACSSSSSSSAVASAGLPHGAGLTPLLPAAPASAVPAARRWPEAPVMFLSGGGVYVHADPRRTSIAGAVQFAAGAQLQGIILHTRALQEELHMVDAARSRGLRVRGGCSSSCRCCPMTPCSPAGLRLPGSPSLLQLLTGLSALL